jgi:hypothetical protein
MYSLIYNSFVINGMDFKVSSATPLYIRIQLLHSIKHLFKKVDRQQQQQTTSSANKTFIAETLKPFFGQAIHTNEKTEHEKTKCVYELITNKSNYSFRVHHPVNRDGRYLLAHAMASDFSVMRCDRLVLRPGGLPLRIRELWVVRSKPARVWGDSFFKKEVYSCSP